MSSTSSLPEELLESFARTYTPNTRIRVISADENPRQHPSNTEETPEEAPLLDADNFPALGREILKLPAEIRELIWEVAMYDEEVLNSHNLVRIRCSGRCNAAPFTPNFIHELVKVSKKTCDEVIAVKMRKSKFVIASVRENTFFFNFLATVGDGSRHVRELCFDNFHYFPDYDRTTGVRIPQCSDLELAVTCTGLRTLRLTMGRQSLETADNNGNWT